MINLIQYINQDNNEQSIKEEAFQRVLKRTFEEEGGFENRPNRIEQPTNMGIRQDTLDRFRNKHLELAKGYPENVANISKEQATEIYKKDYFEPYHIGEIRHKPIQETMFDSFVNHSPKSPATWAQKAINNNTSIKVDEDGIFGPKTIAAINYLDKDEDIKRVNNYILDQRLEERNINARQQGNIYINRTKGIPNRIERFRLK